MLVRPTYKIYTHRDLLSSDQLLLALRSRTHLFTECKIRHLETSKRLQTNKDDGEHGNDCQKCHEDAWREVIVFLEQATFLSRGSTWVRADVALQLRLHGMVEGVLHLICGIDGGCAFFERWCGSVDYGVVVGASQIYNAVLQFGIYASCQQDSVAVAWYAHQSPAASFSQHHGIWVQT